MRIVMILVAALVATGCGRARHDIAFCTVDGDRFDSEPMIIDLDKGVLHGTDVSHHLQIVGPEFAKGFVAPFPLVLPRLPLPQLPDRWQLEGYEFAVSSPRSAPADWILIQGQPLRADQGVVNRSAVLYSLTKGVVAVQVSSEFDGRSIVNDFIFCGTGSLRGSSFD